MSWHFVLNLNSTLNNVEVSYTHVIVYVSVYLNVCGVNPKDHGIKQELVGTAEDEISVINYK